MTKLDQEPIARANDQLIKRCMQCVNELADEGYSALVVSEINAIHQACNILVGLYSTFEQMP